MRHDFPKERRTVLYFAATTVIALMVSLTPLRGERAKRESKADTPERLIVLLDGYFQTRFELDEGRFGLNRLPPPVNGHGSILYELQISNDREREIVRAVNSSRYEYLVEFLHCPHPTGSAPGIRRAIAPTTTRTGVTLIAAKSPLVTFKVTGFPKEREQFRKATEEPLERHAIADLPRLKLGSALDTSFAGWRVALRPIRVSTATCLNCHTGAKAGDMLGVMLYAVRPPSIPSPPQAHEGTRPGS